MLSKITVRADYTNIVPQSLILFALQFYWFLTISLLKDIFSASNYLRFESQICLTAEN